MFLSLDDRIGGISYHDDYFSCNDPWLDTVNAPYTTHLVTPVQDFWDDVAISEKEFQTFCKPEPSDPNDDNGGYMPRSLGADELQSMTLTVDSPIGVTLYSSDGEGSPEMHAPYVRPASNIKQEFRPPTYLESRYTQKKESSNVRHKALGQRTYATKNTRSKSRRSTTKATQYCGVSFHKRSKRFDASAWNREKGRQEYLGSFPDEETAAVARDLFIIHLYNKRCTSCGVVSDEQDDFSYRDTQLTSVQQAGPRRKAIEKSMNQDQEAYPAEMREFLANSSTDMVLRMLRNKDKVWTAYADKLRQNVKVYGAGWPRLE